MAVLYLRDESGQFVPIPTIKGEKGDKGDQGPPGKDGGGLKSDYINDIVVLDKADYDKLPAKESKTLYLIRG